MKKKNEYIVLPSIEHRYHIFSPFFKFTLLFFLHFNIYLKGAGYTGSINPWTAYPKLSSCLEFCYFYAYSLKLAIRRHYISTSKVESNSLTRLKCSMQTFEQINTATHFQSKKYHQIRQMKKYNS